MALDTGRGTPARRPPGLDAHRGSPLTPSHRRGQATLVLRMRGEASVLATRLGRWSGVWERRITAWHAHVGRHPESWSYRLLHNRGEPWLRARRSFWATRSHTERAGRTRTRALTGGRVQKRWEAGYMDMRRKLGPPPATPTTMPSCEPPLLLDLPDGPLFCGDFGAIGPLTPAQHAILRDIHQQEAALDLAGGFEPAGSWARRTLTYG